MNVDKDTNHPLPKSLLEHYVDMGKTVCFAVSPYYPLNRPRLVIINNTIANVSVPGFRQPILEIYYR